MAVVNKRNVENCKLCLYVGAWQDNSLSGVPCAPCRRYPPDASGKHPKVRTNGWCGEFKKHPAFEKGGAEG